MKTARERFEDNYMAISVPADNKKGFKIEYVYYAPWHYWDLPKPELKRVKRVVALEMLAGILLFALASGVDTGVNKTVSVLVPGAVCLCGMIFELLGVCQFFFSKYETTRTNMQDVTNKLMFATLVHLFAAAAASLLGALYMDRNGVHPLDVLCVSSYLLSGVAGVDIRRRYAGIPRREKANDALDKYEPMTKE